MHIDWWTLALQTVNVLILIWILGRFFFRPVADLVAKRRAEVARLLADADAARKEGENLRAEAARQRADVDAQHDRLIVEARKAADVEKASLLAEFSRELDQRRTEAEIAIGKERSAMQGAVLVRASEVSVEIARRLLERIPPGTVLSAFLDGLSGELGKLPAQSRQNLAASSADHPVEVRSAAALSDGEVTRLRETIRAALGSELPMRLSCDPDLIAGFEIRGRNAIVRNNWQADLAAIRQELER